jgi:glycosyltransferase involved in cell wall biosynthesis
MRILWHSNAPWLKTGYGQQTALWTTRLAQLGHEVMISAFTGMVHGHMMWEGIPVMSAGESPIGMDVIGYYYKRHAADVAIVLADAWALSQAAMSPIESACWTPVDTDPLSRGLREFFAGVPSARPLAMARFGQRQLAGAGITAGYVPHGIDTQLFRPPADRAALRPAGDTFITGINQANRSGLRKALPEQLLAWSRFHARHPDSHLVLHMGRAHPKGQDLPLLLATLGVGPDAVSFPDRGAWAAGEVPAEDMPGWYGALDVLMGCAMAGGFEIPLIEAQACGTPVIATDGSAMTEVAGPHSWLVKGQPFWVQERHEAFWTMPLVDEIDAALEAAWQARENGEMPARRAAARAHAERYDADLVLAQYWKPYLDQVQETL